MNAYPPGGYLADAMQTLPPAAPDVPPQTVEVDAGGHWGRFRITFVCKRNPRRGMTKWFWAIDSGVCIEPPMAR